MTKLCTLCQLFLVIGLAGSSNAAWPLQTRIDDAVARHGAEVCPGLGRPFALMRDIRDKTHALVGHVPGVETKTDVAKRRRITKALLLGLPGTTADATPAGLRPLI